MLQYRLNHPETYSLRLLQRFELNLDIYKQGNLYRISRITGRTMPIISFYALHMHYDLAHSEFARKTVREIRRRLLVVSPGDVMHPSPIGILNLTLNWHFGVRNEGSVVEH